MGTISLKSVAKPEWFFAFNTKKKCDGGTPTSFSGAEPVPGEAWEEAPPTFFLRMQ